MQFGTVTGRILATIADRPSDGNVEPDVVPVSGTVRFTPSVNAAISSSEGAIVLPTPIDAYLDDQGYLSLNGVRGVSLVATDSPDLNPTGFTYTVSFIDLKFDKFALAYKSFSMALPAGSTVDLATVTPVGSSNGAIIIRGEQGEPGPQGDPGPKGDPGPTIVDPVTQQFPDAVRARIAANIKDPNTVEGAAVGSALNTAGVSYTVLSTGSVFGDPNIVSDYGTVSYTAGKSGQAKAAGSVIRVEHTPAAIAAIKAAGGFTIEAWVKTAPSGNYSSFYAMGPIGSTSTGSVLLNTSNNAHLAPSNIGGSANVADSAWHHVAYCVNVDANGANWTNGKVYVDGVLDITDTKTVSAGTAWLSASYIGGLTGGTNGAGAAIDEFRVSSGIRYTAAFTPPTAVGIDPTTVVSMRFENNLATESSGYGPRPANAPAGSVTYIGSAQPSTWLAKDRWIKA